MQSYIYQLGSLKCKLNFFTRHSTLNIHYLQTNVNPMQTNFNWQISGVLMKNSQLRSFIISYCRLLFNNPRNNHRRQNRNYYFSFFKKLLICFSYWKIFIYDHQWFITIVLKLLMNVHPDHVNILKNHFSDKFIKSLSPQAINRDLWEWGDIMRTAEKNLRLQGFLKELWQTQEKHF